MPFNLDLLDLLVALLFGCVPALLVWAGRPLLSLMQRHATGRSLLGSLSLLLGTLAACATAMVLPAPATAAQPAEMLPTHDTAVEFGEQDPTADSSAVSSSPSSTRTLRVAPEIANIPDHGVVIPPGRPDWVEAEPVRDGDVHTTAVYSELHQRESECRRSLDERIQQATAAYIEEYLGDSRASLFFNIPLSEIKQRFLRSENVYHEVVQVSFGKMHQAHALLEFTPDFREQLQARWDQIIKAMRLLQTVAIAAGIVLMLAVLYGFFRADTATRGYYTRRLQLLTAAVILTVIIASVLLARTSDAWVMWIL